MVTTTVRSTRIHSHLLSGPYSSTRELVQTSKSSSHSTPNSRPAHSASDLASFLAEKMAATHGNSCTCLSIYLQLDTISPPGVRRLHPFHFSSGACFSNPFSFSLSSFLFVALAPSQQTLQMFPILSNIKSFHGLTYSLITMLASRDSFNLDILST